MPELPEVETVLRTLEKQLGHVMVESVHVLWDNIIAYPSVELFKERVKNCTIQNYRRHGKYMLFDLGDVELVCHMRMEGKFYIQQPQEALSKHIHVIFSLRDGRELRYHDTRKFGKMYVYEKITPYQNYPCFLHIGKDAFDETLHAIDLYQSLHHKHVTLKSVLLDQHVIAGIGNIYADEICFALGRHPETRISKLTKKEFERLLIETRRILDGASKAGGTTIRSYTSSLGVDGRFQLKLKVHGKKGDACCVCQSEIVKIKVATRGTYYCPVCQKKR